MIKSMTGFCKTQVTHKDITCNVEVRSVNHRYLEARIHLPKQFQNLEELLKRQLKKMINRGKVDVYLQIAATEDQTENLSVSTPVWENFKSIVSMLEVDIGRGIQLNMADLLNVKGLLVYVPEEMDVADYETLFALAVEQGISELVKMREREGELLYKDIITHVNEMQVLIDSILFYKDEIVNSYCQRLKKNLKNLNLTYEQDDPRIMQEIGIFMDRADITEEIERFKTHLVQLRELLNGNNAVGRKLDFILQELNREANTICSKSTHVQLTQIGVALKCEIEKTREQIQNIE